MKVLCLFMFVAAAVVTISESASFTYRNGREANEIVQAIENEMIREEIVSELRKEVGAAELAVEEAKPIVADGQPIVREEILVPIETLKLAEPMVEIQEPIAIVMDKEIIAAPVLRSAAPEMIAIEEAAFVPMAAAAAVEPAAPVAIVAEDAPAVKDVVPEIRAQSIVEDAVPAVAADEPAVVEKDVKSNTVVAAEPIIPVAVDTVAEKDMEMRQAAEPARPTLIQTAQNTIQNLLTNNPIANAIQAIRGDDAAAASPAAAAPAATEGGGAAAAPAEGGAETVTKENGDSDAAAPTPRPTFIQQFQSNVQNFQNQIQSVLQNGLAAAAPGQNAAAGGAGAAGEAPSRPGFIATIQQNIGAALNRPLAIFRPNAANQGDTVTEQKEGAMDVIDVEAVGTADQPGPLIVNEKVDVVNDKIENDAQ